MNNKLLYKTITLASLVGFIASFSQMLEKLALLKNPETVLICNINSIFSCTNILGAWQSSVFGFPNALMCIIFFTITFSAGFIAWFGGEISAKVRLILQGMAVFFVGFGFWYFWQSIFVIGGLCIYCVFCYASVLTIAWAWLRLNQKDLPFSKKIKSSIQKMIQTSNDIYIWLGIALAIVIEVVIRFSI